MANVSSAQARDTTTVRVTLSTGLADLTTGANGALNPGNWAVAGQPSVSGLDAFVSVAVTAVAEISTSVFDLTVDDDMTFGRTYQVTAAAASGGGITGVADSPNNRATFTAVTPRQPAGRDFDVSKMVPNLNLGEDAGQDLVRFLSVLKDSTDVLLAAIDRWGDIFDSERAPENFIDLLLQDLGYPFQIALSELDKRRLLPTLVGLHKGKGTATGIQSALRFFLGYESDVIWQDSLRSGGWILGVSELGVDTLLGDAPMSTTLHGSDMMPYFDVANRFSFFVKIGKGSALSADETTNATAIIEYMKPAGRHLLGVAGVLPPPTAVATPGVGQVSVSWSSVVAATDYAVFWSPSPIVNALSPYGAVDAASPYVDTVPTGEKRWYVVCARDGSGINGVSSPVVSATAT